MENQELFVKKQKKWHNRYYGKYNLKKSLKKYLTKSRSCLDFGCGFGNLSHLLAKDYQELDVYGFDINKNQINYGKKQFKQKNIHLISKIPFKKFDTILTFNVLHEIKNVDKTLALFINHLNKHGFLIIYDFRKVSKESFKPWYEKKRIIDEYKKSFEEEYLIHNRFTEKEFKEKMKTLNIKTLQCKKTGDYWFWYVGKKTN